MQKINAQNLGLRKEYDALDTSSGVQLGKMNSKGFRNYNNRIKIPNVFIFLMLSGS